MILITMKKLTALVALLSATIVSAQEEYTLSDQSTLAIEGTSTLHDWTVSASLMDGKIALSENENTIDFSVLVENIRGDRAEAMNNKMHDALKMEEHPKVMVSVGGLDASVTGEQNLKGTMNIAGVKKEVSIPAQVLRNNGQLQITGEHKIVLGEYNIEPPTAMFGTIVVGDEVTVNFDLTFEDL